MGLRILPVPYDSGDREKRMGSGPERLHDLGLLQALETAGVSVSLERIQASESFPAEINTSFELYRALSERVQVARKGGAFPLALAGNCGSVSPHAPVH